MPLKYRIGMPYFRRVTHTIRKEKRIPALTLEGQILSINGFKVDDTIRIISKGKGELLIKKIRWILFGVQD